MKIRHIFISIALLSLMAANTLAQEAALPQVVGKPAGVQYPFTAEVTGDDVYIRTGNSMNDYHSGKAGKGFKVTVIDEVLGWAKILPPDGSYSWISKSYVNVTPGKNTGVVTGDSVRVWAGSDYREPIHSPSLQTKLNSGEVVELMPNQPASSDYFKIKPPAGAHLWISAEFLKYAGSLQQDKPVVVPPRPDTAGQTATSTATAPAASADQPAIPVTKDDKAAVETLAAEIKEATEQPRPEFSNLPGAEAVPADPNAAAAEKTKVKALSKENQYIRQNYQLSAKIDEIVKKPEAEWDFAEVKQSLEAIKADPEAGRAAEYAKNLLDRIAGHELAISTVGEIKQQEDSLKQTREQIEKAHQAELSKLPKEADYLYIGMLKPSYVYSDKSGAKRYLLMDANGKIISYLIAASPEVGSKMETLVNTKVGIKGDIANNAKSLVTLVNVTNVDSMP